jgi:type VI protein secretion system component Hcp
MRVHEVAIFGMMLTLVSVAPVLAGKSGGGNGNSTATHQDVQITKSQDNASPKLAKPLAKGQHYPKTILHTRAQ